jgi:flavin reductase (DIM6/NTAB) family NADH-FMN oxidoreductase RutF
MLSVAVKKERPILESLKKGNQFSVNVLSKKNMDIFKNFAKPYTDGLNRFEGLTVSTAIASGPVFSECVAYMACRVHELVEAGDHYLVLGEILSGAVLHSEEEPMTHLRKNGFQY